MGRHHVRSRRLCSSSAYPWKQSGHRHSHAVLAIATTTCVLYAIRIWTNAGIHTPTGAARVQLSPEAQLSFPASGDFQNRDAIAVASAREAATAATGEVSSATSTSATSASAAVAATKSPLEEAAAEATGALRPPASGKPSSAPPSEALHLPLLDYKAAPICYPTARKPPCRWLVDVKLSPLECVELLGKVVGFSGPHPDAFPVRTIGAWSAAVKLDNCTRVDVWVLHHLVLTSPQLPVAIAALPNAPPVVVIDDSGEVGQMEFANCFFNEMLDKGSIHGAKNVTFILASQTASLRRPGQRLFNQHWVVPKILASLEQSTGAPKAGHDTLDTSALDRNPVHSSRVLCLGGFPRPHKVQFFGELDARGLLERMLWSAGTPEPWLVENLNMSLNHYKYTAQEAEEARRAITKMPRILDQDRGTKKANGMTYKSALYELAPVHVVIESNDRIPSIDRHACARTYRYTEKTLKAMYARARFVVFGDPASLQLLRDHGFRTFHPHINETYDVMPTYRGKLDALFAEIDRLLFLSDVHFRKFLQDTAPIVEHNRQWLLSDEFAARVDQQSLFAFGLSDEPGFQSLDHERMLDTMYASVNVDCKSI